MEKELAKVKSENRQLLSNLEAAENTNDGHHGNIDDITHKIATLETKLLEYSRTISKWVWSVLDHMSCRSST